MIKKIKFSLVKPKVISNIGIDIFCILISKMESSPLNNLVEDTFPNCFKKAYIVRIPKVANATEVKDLHPISNTSIFSKIFERFIFNWLYVDIKESIDPRQFGFQPECSTIHYLFTLQDEMLRILECQDSSVDLLIADMVKAFDYLDHPLVVSGANNMGARKFIVRLLASFLSDRLQRVQLSLDIFSEFLRIACGAPQGTILGPIAFVIAVNGLLKKKPNRAQFADDLSLPLLRQLATVKDDLKLAFDELTVEAQEAGMEISKEKRAVMRLNFLKKHTGNIETEQEQRCC